MSDGFRSVGSVDNEDDVEQTEELSEGVVDSDPDPEAGNGNVGMGAAVPNQVPNSIPS